MVQIKQMALQETTEAEYFIVPRIPALVWAVCCLGLHHSDPRAVTPHLQTGLVGKGGQQGAFGNYSLQVNPPD